MRLDQGWETRRVCQGPKSCKVILAWRAHLPTLDHLEQVDHFTQSLKLSTNTVTGPHQFISTNDKTPKIFAEDRTNDAHEFFAIQPPRCISCRRPALSAPDLSRDDT